MNKQCDHNVGHLKEFVFASELKETLIDESNQWNDFLNNEERKPIDFLDGRRGYMSLFKFCPLCGHKINWKEIKNNIKSET